MALGNVAGQLIGFAALAYVARRVGAVNLGAYNFALALASYFGLIANLGVAFMATRDVAQDPDSMTTTVRETLILQVGLSAAMYLLFIALSSVLIGYREARVLVPIVGLTFVSSALTLNWVFLATGRAKVVAIWSFAGQVAYGLGVLLLVDSGAQGVERYAALNVVGLVVTATGLGGAYLRMSRGASRTVTPGFLLRRLATRLRRSVPFGYVLIMLSIYGGIDVVMLGYLDSSRAVGIYAVASKIPAALLALAIVWTSVLFPHTARQLQAKPDGLASELGSVITAAVVVLMLVGSGAAVCGNALIPALFRPAFRAASTPFVLLSVAAGLALIEATFSNVLLASESRRYYAICLTIAAALMVVLNACLIPPLGVVGSAIATIAGEVFIAAITARGAVRLLGPIPVQWRRIVRGGIAVTGTAAIMTIAQHYLGLVPALAAGGITFMTAAWALSVFDRALWQSVKLPA